MPVTTCSHPDIARPRRASSGAIERAARLFRAVADASRLKLLEHLDSGEACVGELAESLAVGVSTVSQQLKVLWTERLVTRRRDGKHIYYRLTDQHVSRLIHEVFDHVEESARPAAPDTE